ncbi:hypothetical protein MXB_3852 [Myxobolus squamalis]|nr:hypothetical protein MXB_3852 [Myxobolus squamalis]
MIALFFERGHPYTLRERKNVMLWRMPMWRGRITLISSIFSLGFLYYGIKIMWDFFYRQFKLTGKDTRFFIMIIHYFLKFYNVQWKRKRIYVRETKIVYPAFYITKNHSPYTLCGRVGIRHFYKSRDFAIVGDGLVTRQIINNNTIRELEANISVFCRTDECYELYQKFLRLADSPSSIFDKYTSYLTKDIFYPSSKSINRRNDFISRVKFKGMLPSFLLHEVVWDVGSENIKERQSKIMEIEPLTNNSTTIILQTFSLPIHQVGLYSPYSR